jgi:hypothetical protein
MPAIKVATGDDPARVVGELSGISRIEPNIIVMSSLVGDLFIGLLAIVEDHEGSLNCAIVGSQKVPDGVLSVGHDFRSSLLIDLLYSKSRPSAHF